MLLLQKKGQAAVEGQPAGSATLVLISSLQWLTHTELALNKHFCNKYFKSIQLKKIKHLLRVSCIKFKFLCFKIPS